MKPHHCVLDLYPAADSIDDNFTKVMNNITNKVARQTRQEGKRGFEAPANMPKGPKRTKMVYASDTVPCSRTGHKVRYKASKRDSCLNPKTICIHHSDIQKAVKPTMPAASSKRRTNHMDKPLGLTGRLPKNTFETNGMCKPLARERFTAFDWDDKSKSKKSKTNTTDRSAKIYANGALREMSVSAQRLIVSVDLSGGTSAAQQAPPSTLPQCITSVEDYKDREVPKPQQIPCAMTDEELDAALGVNTQHDEYTTHAHGAHMTHTHTHVFCFSFVCTVTAAALADHVTAAALANHWHVHQSACFLLLVTVYCYSCCPGRS